MLLMTNLLTTRLLITHSFLMNRLLLTTHLLFMNHLLLITHLLLRTSFLPCFYPVGHGLFNGIGVNWVQTLKYTCMIRFCYKHV